MIFLEASNIATQSWFAINFMNIITTIAVIVNGIYVFYTIKTFREIRKQTDLQLKAHLSLETKIIKDSDLNKQNVLKDYLDINFSDDWKTSMQTAFPELSDPGILSGVFYCISVANYGNTEVKQISFNIEIIIENSKSTVETKKLTAKETKITSKKITEILHKGESLTIPLFSIAAFPIYTVNISGKYLDVRNEEYNIVPLTDKRENSYLH